MKSRRKELIGPFILLVISLAIFTILVIALVPELNREEVSSPTETVEQTQMPVISLATVTPSTTPARAPTFTAESTTPADNSSPQATTIAPSITPQAASKLEDQIVTPRATKRGKTTPCPPWMFWCKWRQ